jgi:hypothetical protein
MSFQQTVFLQQGFGVPGELYTDSPHRAWEYTLVSASAAYNIIGATAYTLTSQGIAQAGNTGGTGVFVGVLANPKEQTLFGVGGSPLSPTLVLPNNVLASLVTMGDLVVTLPAAAAIGDYVIFDNVTGALSTVPPSTSPFPGTGKSAAFAVVSYFTVAAAGLAVITLNPGIGIPT